MLVRDLFEGSGKTYHLKNEYGELEARYKTDLASEENENYLPPGYSYDKVIELQWLETPEVDKGHGTRLMNEFLASSFVKGAELIFLDLGFAPHHLRNRNMSSHDYFKYLASFYRKFGFENNGKDRRMWKVLKGHVQTKDLPG